MFLPKEKRKNSGMGLIEIIIGLAIILAGVLASNVAYTTYVQFAFSNEGNVQASYLSEEGLEAIAFLRDKSWSTYILPLSTTTTYYLYFNGSYWSSTTTVQYVDGKFLRSFQVSDVKRDANDRIALSGTFDTNTKGMTVTISYFQGHATSTKSIATYLANIYNN